MKKIVVLLIFTLCILVGCSSTETVNLSDPCSVTGTTEITFVTQSGSVNDKSFNQGIWEGIEKYCIDNPEVGATYIETTEDTNVEENLEKAAKQSDIVVASGYALSQPVANVAAEYTGTHFVLIDAEPRDSEGNVVQLDNVMSYSFASEQAGYLVGYIAAKSTNTDHIGFIGGEVSDAVNTFVYGYIQGAQAANPNIIIDIEYANTFEDVAVGRSLATTMYDNGCDIIFTAAGGTGIGVMEVAIERSTAGDEVWVIGVDVDQYSDGIYTAADGSQQSVVLTSAVKNVGSAAYAGLTAHFEEKWVGGSTTTLTIKDEAVGLPIDNPNLKPELVEEATAALYDNIDSIATDLESVEQVITTATINGELK